MSDQQENIDSIVISDITGTPQFELCGIRSYIEKCDRNNEPEKVKALEDELQSVIDNHTFADAHDMLADFLEEDDEDDDIDDENRRIIEERLKEAEAIDAAIQAGESIGDMGGAFVASGNVFVDLGLPDADERLEVLRKYTALHKDEEDLGRPDVFYEGYRAGKEETKRDEDHNFFAEHGIPDAKERFRVYKMFRAMYGEDEKRFPTFYRGYQLGFDDGDPVLNTLLDFAVRAVCYVAESMPENDQEILAGRMFRLLPEIIFKNCEK